MRLIQHKREAYWFYRFLSVFYDGFVNPLFWTEAMRDEALALARLDDPSLRVIDVGSGTGFTTQGIIRHLDGRQVTCLDQSPHQMAKAKRKADLQKCTFVLGDAENLPFPTDYFDRYISAGSIEYWPHPQGGINEAYRVIRPGGVALLIGPLEPGRGFPRLMANLWMLFPKESEYRDWFERAGFQQIRVRYVRPHWHHNDKSEYGIAIAGVKPVSGPPLHADPGGAEAETPMTFGRRLQMLGRLLLGSIAGFVFIPIALLASLRGRVSGGGSERLNRYQVIALLVRLTLLIWLLWKLFD